MTNKDALHLALAILRPFAEGGNIYTDYQDDEGFTDEQYHDMLDALQAMEVEAGGGKEAPGPDDSEPSALDHLEELLSITERFKPDMDKDELRLWQNISAKTADMRDGSDV